KPELPVLPDLRNLGTILRVLIAVNGAALVVAFARAPRLSQTLADWVGLTGFVEPHLIVELALLYVLYPLLARLPYGPAVSLVAVLTVLAAVVVHVPLASSGTVNTEGLVRHAAFALGALAALLAYFRLRAKALSPAITEARLQ